MGEEGRKFLPLQDLHLPVYGNWLKLRTGFTLIQSENAMAALLPVWVEDTLPLPMSSVNRWVIMVTASRRKAGSSTKVTWTIISTLSAPWESPSCGLWEVCPEFLSRLSPALWVTDPGLQRWGGVAQTAQHHWFHQIWFRLFQNESLFPFIQICPQPKCFPVSSGKCGNHSVVLAHLGQLAEGVVL